MQDFREIYKQEGGGDLSEDEASVAAKRLLTLYRALAKTLPDENDHAA